GPYSSPIVSGPVPVGDARTHQARCPRGAPAAGRRSSARSGRAEAPRGDPLRPGRRGDAKLDGHASIDRAMHGRGLPAPGRLLVSLIAVWFLTTGTVAAADDQDWLVLVERSREALSSLAPDPAAPEASGCLRTIVVGFTGGLEGGESRISGVVRLRKKI